MTEFVIYPPKGGGAGADSTFSSGDSSTEFQQRDDSKVSLQLLVSYLAFCSEQKISSRTALDILDECSVDCGARSAPKTAFIEAFYRAADLAQKDKS